MAAKKITRKRLLKEPDEFLSLSKRFVQYVQTHPSQAVLWGSVAGGVILLVALGVFLYNYYEGALEREYNRTLVQAALETDVKKRIDVLEGFVQNHSGGKLTGIVAARLGRARYEAKEYQQAVDTLKSALKEIGDDPRLGRAVRSDLAYAYEALGETAKAADLLEKSTKGEQTFLKEEQMLHLARLYTALGKTGQARAVYERFLKTFPDSASKDLVDSLLRELPGP